MKASTHRDAEVTRAKLPLLDRLPPKQPVELPYPHYRHRPVPVQDHPIRHVDLDAVDEHAGRGADDLDGRATGPLADLDEVVPVDPPVTGVRNGATTDSVVLPVVPPTEATPEGRTPTT